MPWGCEPPISSSWRSLCDSSEQPSLQTTALEKSLGVCTGWYLLECSQHIVCNCENPDIFHCPRTERNVVHSHNTIAQWKLTAATPININEFHKHIIEWKSHTQNSACYMTVYIKFKNRQSKSMLLEVRAMVSMRGVVKKGACDLSGLVLVTFRLYQCSLGKNSSLRWVYVMCTLFPKYNIIKFES